jgi:hypothetical protein
MGAQLVRIAASPLLHQVAPIRKKVTHAGQALSRGYCRVVGSEGQAESMTGYIIESESEIESEIESELSSVMPGV